jgi:hypothetical protein
LAWPLTLSSPSILGVGLPTNCFDDAIRKKPPAAPQKCLWGRCVC